MLYGDFDVVSSPGAEGFYWWVDIMRHVNIDAWHPVRIKSVREGFIEVSGVPIHPPKEAVCRTKAGFERVVQIEMCQRRISFPVPIELERLDFEFRGRLDEQGRRIFDEVV